MTFLVDAQLPIRLCDLLVRYEHDVEIRLDDLESAFGGADLVELRQDLLVIHQRP